VAGKASIFVESHSEGFGHEDHHSRNPVRWRALRVPPDRIVNDFNSVQRRNREQAGPEARAHGNGVNA